VATSGPDVGVGHLVVGGLEGLGVIGRAGLAAVVATSAGAPMAAV
jgi:hypothetical protein